MRRASFLTTPRTFFSVWTGEDGELAQLLWGEEDVARYLSAAGRFTREEIRARLLREIKNQEECGVQYWPFFEGESRDLIGCCGLRPYGRRGLPFEIGFHLQKKYWGQGYAAEGAEAVMGYAGETLGAAGLFAGHHPANKGSQKLLEKLGFVHTGDEYYPPTGLVHPSYEYRFYAVR